MTSAKKFLSAILFGCWSVTAFGAVRGPEVEAPRQVLEHLNAPLKLAVEYIYALGPKGYKSLYQVSFGQQYPMAVRWKAFMVMSRIGGEKAKPEIAQALAAKEWFLRSAGLLAMEQIDQPQSLVVARQQFANDRALMVRAQALEVLRNDPSQITKELMWRKLYATENFHRSRGLWIRKKITKYLADYATPADLKKFKKLFVKNELELLPLAIPAFERLLGKKSAAGLTPTGQIAFWQNELTRL